MLQGAKVWLYLLETRDSKRWKRQTQRDSKRWNRQTESIILQGARVWLYLLETERDSMRWNRQTDRQRSLSYRVQGSDCTYWRPRETQRDETDRQTDRDHYPTGCKGLIVPAGDRDSKRWNRQTEIIILQGARVWLYLLETRETQIDETDRQTDRDHYHTGCKGLTLTVPAGDTGDLEMKQTDRDHYPTGCKSLAVPAGAGTEEQWCDTRYLTFTFSEVFLQSVSLCLPVFLHICELLSISPVSI